MLPIYPSCLPLGARLAARERLVDSTKSVITLGLLPKGVAYCIRGVCDSVNSAAHILADGRSNVATLPDYLQWTHGLPS